MRRWCLAAAVLLTGCGIGNLVGPQQPPCAQEACLVIQTWYAPAQQWTSHSTCWCAKVGWP